MGGKPSPLAVARAGEASLDSGLDAPMRRAPSIFHGRKVSSKHQILLYSPQCHLEKMWDKAMLVKSSGLLWNLKKAA